MKQIKLKIIIFISLIVLLQNCSGVKEAFEGQKRSEQSDEFLVKKKNPLAMPPDFDKLPTPGNQEVSTEIPNENNEVKDLLNLDDNKNKIVEKDGSSTDIESSILEKIQ